MCVVEFADIYGQDKTQLLHPTSSTTATSVSFYCNTDYNVNYIYNTYVYRTISLKGCVHYIFASLFLILNKSTY